MRSGIQSGRVVAGQEGVASPGRERSAAGAGTGALAGRPGPGSPATAASASRAAGGAATPASAVLAAGGAATPASAVLAAGGAAMPVSPADSGPFSGLAGSSTPTRTGEAGARRAAMTVAAVIAAMPTGQDRKSVV